MRRFRCRGRAGSGYAYIDDVSLVQAPAPAGRPGGLRMGLLGVGRFWRIVRPLGLRGPGDFREHMPCKWATRRALGRRSTACSPVRRIRCLSSARLMRGRHADGVGFWRRDADGDVYGVRICGASAARFSPPAQVERREHYTYQRCGGGAFADFDDFNLAQAYTMCLRRT